jgi:valyl-tRNA synthetase
VLEESLALLHPFLPFVTEEIYGKLPGAKGRLIAKPYPEDLSERRDPVLDVSFAALQELVTIVRSLRSEFSIAPERKLRVAVRFDEGFSGGGFFERNAALVALLAGASGVEFVSAKPEGALSLAGRGFEAYVFAREAVDAAQLAARFAKEAEKERQYAERTRAKLGNEAFVASAPAEVVEKERQKLKDAEIRAAKLEKYLGDLA